MKTELFTITNSYGMKRSNQRTPGGTTQLQLCDENEPDNPSLDPSHDPSMCPFATGAPSNNGLLRALFWVAFLLPVAKKPGPAVETHTEVLSAKDQLLPSLQK